MIDYALVFANFNGAFPDITAKNVTAPGAGNGTEFIKALVDDVWGRAQAIMNYAGLTPDGVAEADGTAQVLEALKKGFAIGPGIGVTYWKNGTPAANGDRVLLLQGQVILISSYADLVSACYVGDGNNATASAYYKTSDAGGVTRSTSGTYFVLPDTRGLSLKNIGNATVNTRTKTGPTDLGNVQEDQGQGFGFASNTQSGAGNAANLNASSCNAFGGPQVAGDTSGTITYVDQVYAGTAKVNAIGDDGTNGTPRTGTNFRDSAIGTNFGITY